MVLTSPLQSAPAGIPQSCPGPGSLTMALESPDLGSIEPGGNSMHVSKH